MKASKDAFKKFMKEHALDRLYYFDRVDIQVNDLAALGPTKKLLKQAKTPVNAKITYNFGWVPNYIKKRAFKFAVGFKVELTQPSVALLKELAPLLLKSHYTISWLEIAYDIKTRNTNRAIELFKLLSSLIVVNALKYKPEIRGEDYVDDNPNAKSIMSAFFGQYENPRMFKMYIPKGKRKVFGSKSVHMEFRFEGAEEIRKIGVWTIQDLVDMKLPDWFKDNVEAYAANKTKIGEIIRKIEGKDDASRAQRLDDFKRKFSSHRAVAHAVYHNIAEVQKSEKNYRNKEKLRKGLIDCEQTWLSGPTR